MFTLFNLQGTPGVFLRFCSAFHRGLTLYAELLYLSTLGLICQALFFLTFSTRGLDLLPSRRVLAYDTSIFPLCQHLFSDFFRFFSRSIFCGFFHRNTTTGCAVIGHPSARNAYAFGRIYNPPLQRAAHFFPIPYSLFPPYGGDGERCGRRGCGGKRRPARADIKSAPTGAHAAVFVVGAHCICARAAPPGATGPRSSWPGPGGMWACRPTARTTLLPYSLPRHGDRGCGRGRACGMIGVI